MTKTITLKTAGYNNPDVSNGMRNQMNKYFNEAKQNSIWNNKNNTSGTNYNLATPSTKGQGFLIAATGITALITGVAALATPIITLATLNKKSNGSNPGNNNANINTQSGVDGLNSAITNYDQNGDIKGLETQIKAQEQQYDANAKLIANMGKQEETENTKAQKTLEEANTANDKQQKVYNTADEAVTKADEAVGVAKAGVTSAQASYNAAKLAYNNAVATNPKADNTALKTAMDNANTALGEATKKEKDAELKRDKAKQARADEKTKLDATMKNLETAKTAADATAKALAAIPKAKQEAEVKNAQLKTVIDQAKAKIPSYKGGEIKKEETKKEDKKENLDEGCSTQETIPLEKQATTDAKPLLIKPTNTKYTFNS